MAFIHFADNSNRLPMNDASGYGGGAGGFGGGFSMHGMGGGGGRAGMGQAGGAGGGGQMVSTNRSRERTAQACCFCLG